MQMMLSESSTPSLLLKQKAWGWGFPLAEESSKTTAGGCGLRRTRTAERPSSLRYHRARGLNHESRVRSVSLPRTTLSARRFWKLVAVATAATPGSKDVPVRFVFLVQAPLSLAV